MAKLTRKSYKRRRIVAGAALFMSIALISTGFAAFVISSQAKIVGDGNVEVGVISEKSIKLEFQDNNTNLGYFSFNVNEGDNTGRLRWGTDPDNSTYDHYESLSVNVAGKITENKELVSKLTIRLIEVTDDSTIADYTEVAKENSGIYKATQSRIVGDVTYAPFLNAPECLYNEIDLPFDAATGDFDYTISFKWGDFFKGDNPGTYYDKEYTDDTEKKFGKYVSDEQMKQDLVDLRKTIYGDKSKDDTVGNQEKDVIPPKYMVIITATPN